MRCGIQATSTPSHFFPLCSGTLPFAFISAAVSSAFTCVQVHGQCALPQTCTLAYFYTCFCTRFCREFMHTHLRALSHTRAFPPHMSNLLQCTHTLTIGRPNAVCLIAPPYRFSLSLGLAGSTCMCCHLLWHWPSPWRLAITLFATVLPSHCMCTIFWASRRNVVVIRNTTISGSPNDNASESPKAFGLCVTTPSYFEAHR